MFDYIERSDSREGRYCYLSRSSPLNQSMQFRTRGKASGGFRGRSRGTQAVNPTEQRPYW
jgi:hypothetical protein